MRLTLPANAASVPQVRHAVVELGRAAGGSERMLADVALAVSEACSNVVVHAYREHAEPGTLAVEAELHGATLEVIVSDEGSGVLPREDSPGLGMGLALMAAVASSLQFDHDGAATRVHLTFDLAPPIAPEDGETAMAADDADATIRGADRD
ncbi:ATP-binding protein [Conexibacter stalactiti]|uniref:ATP-binding protein n=1 Tax=Conexibacter stalactiti TaxID=1940611 RepID=A0ABU4HIY6_9ACTN|nr:ATP-binding protein [Conexibacter stalactiti]MDW5593220.1 ATP-binding protein [Conexibacter stalactiti]MEC5033861.1 ATP-binding protein [Conexibacter stalactiti]